MPFTWLSHGGVKRLERKWRRVLKRKVRGCTLFYGITFSRTLYEIMRLHELKIHRTIFIKARANLHLVINNIL